VFVAAASGATGASSTGDSRDTGGETETCGAEEAAGGSVLNQLTVMCVCECVHAVNTADIDVLM